MQQLLSDARLAIGELILIIFCGAVWMVNPQAGVWFILIALSLFLLKVFTGIVEFNSSDWLLLIFLITMVVGYWAAYDRTAAWNKAWLIVAGILLYYSLRVQPKENLTWVSVLLFSIGVCTSLYYFLTYDFVAAPRRIDLVNSIGRWIMSVRPQTGWTSIHPNYVAGIVALTVPFIFYPIWEYRKANQRVPVMLYSIVAAGLGAAFLALVMATSRGVILAVASGVGAWFLWRLTQLNGIRRQFRSEAVFPILLLIYLCLIIGFLYIGPAQVGGVVSNSNFYGIGSRAELLTRSLYLVLDYPITGGGLGSFPGLYSQYLLMIPFFYLPNGHNLFLDISIEQGLFGGLSILILYIISLWNVSISISKGYELLAFKWLVLFSLIVVVVHGMVDNYLYNGIGSMLVLFPIGLSWIGGQQGYSSDRKWDILKSGLIFFIWLMITLLNLNSIRSVWYANIGAVQLAKVELAGFPTGEWTGTEIVPSLDVAEASLHASLQLDPVNRTANHRLGLISMLRTDFDSAVGYLEIAHTRTPNHRGIIKSLGYGYVWLGDFEKAQRLLSEIPEANVELGIYAWWWGERGRYDLSGNASQMVSRLASAVVQP